MSPITDSKVSYDDRGSGSGPALLCLPGWCGPRTVFDPVAERLAADHRVLTLDWRGHGDSGPAPDDLSYDHLVDDAVGVIEQAGAERVVPVALSHAGWVAIELHRRLGSARVPKLVLIDWMVLGPPPPFLGALGAMADPGSTRAVVDQLMTMWSDGLDIAELSAYLETMAASPDHLWQRAAREISAAFDCGPSPLEAIAGLDGPPPTLHLYAQPADPELLEAQKGYAAANPWFQVERLDARSHFPMFEVPDAMAAAITAFARS
jgi:pimeloyl-ACP methyl ester carboxylesterase